MSRLITYVNCGRAPPSSLFTYSTLMQSVLRIDRIRRCLAPPAQAFLALARLLSTAAHPPPEREISPVAAIAIGANIGDRLQNIREALKSLQRSGIKVLRHSRLYESAAAYVTDQPAFLNAAIAVHTNLAPKELLSALKSIEAAAGRDFEGRRWGPRPLDLDIIFYGAMSMKEATLQLPHARWRERGFVKAPLADLYTAAELRQLPGPLRPSLLEAQALWEQEGGEAQLGGLDLRCVLPMGKRQQLWPWQGRTHIMGILNVTPDSFSDSGLSLAGPDAALRKASALVADGADILDIGGQSTRPGANPISAEEELTRILPVIRWKLERRRLKEDESFRGVPISVDTFSSRVASEAVGGGADLVNDVSGGTMDPHMLATVAELGVSYVIVHMRGTPKTMQSAENTSYTPGRLAAEVGAELQQRAEAAVASGVEPWRIVLDPGIGFAKTWQGNCELMRDLPAVKRQLRGCLQGQPLLAGSSRKGFLGWLTGRKVAADRDIASAVASSICIAGGANLIRMHDAVAGREVGRVADAVLHERYPPA